MKLEVCEHRIRIIATEHDDGTERALLGLFARGRLTAHAQTTTGGSVYALAVVSDRALTPEPPVQDAEPRP